ncbi:GNAT family N-acetyltransferase [Pseudohoeflea coraliihabitans]|uniref:GNAT family N-acetyltransferase n=1 Tax=Pseudohoeflea coraliihabitans TaxID=2860393 RepID=A0ABS6WL49_9HYPH|nr:GNAT family protein [Pseudohoeflea sp. DP4N28-3]MBW3096662.1 GNAT family N-acetyltransferase [Pseudohoeflea sp. DP4N28-3]
MTRSAPPRIRPPLAAQRLKPVFIDRWSDKLRLRTLKPSEVTPVIEEWLTAPEIMEGVNAPRAAMGTEAFRAYVASFDNIRRNLVAIRNRSDDAPLGLMMLELDLRHKVGALHVVIGEADHRNLSTTINAVRIMVRYFFIERKMEKLTFQPLARNRAAVAACTFAMLTLEGTLRSHRIDGRTGERLDQMVFGMTREEYVVRDQANVKAGTAAPYEGPGVPAAVRRALPAELE